MSRMTNINLIALFAIVLGSIVAWLNHSPLAFIIGLMLSVSVVILDWWMRYRART